MWQCRLMNKYNCVSKTNRKLLESYYGVASCYNCRDKGKLMDDNIRRVVYFEIKARGDRFSWTKTDYLFLLSLFFTAQPMDTLHSCYAAPTCTVKIPSVKLKRVAALAADIFIGWAVSVVVRTGIILLLL